MSESHDHSGLPNVQPESDATLKVVGLSILGESPAWRIVTLLAFTAGGVDAISLSAVQHYSAHLSGTTSLLTGALVSLDLRLLLLCGAVIVAFLIGAVISGVIIVAAESGEPHRVGAHALLLEGALIAAATPALLSLHGRSLNVAIVLGPLAMAMGLQNRTSVYLAGGKARSTHVTGTLTDIGFYIGCVLRRGFPASAKQAEESAAALQLGLLFCGFLLGGVIGRLIFLLAGALAPAVYAAIPISSAIIIQRTVRRPSR